MHVHASEDKKIGEGRIFRGLCYMQVRYMQLFNKNWTLTLSIGSLREGILLKVLTLL
jgi:hypothetical protein